MKDATGTTTDLMTKIIPLKHDLEEVDLEADGDAKNQFELDDTVDTMETVKEIEPTTPKENEGRVKRFFNEIKNNCKTADTVVESEYLIHHIFFGSSLLINSLSFQWKKM